MARRNRFGIRFDGFDEMAKKFADLGGDLKGLSEKALKDSHAYVTPKLHDAMKKHRRTGRTEASIVDEPVITWNGTVATVPIGFDLEKGGLPSVFLMYGTPKHQPNNPGMRQDKSLYNAVYGSKTKKDIADLQKQIFADAIKEKMEE